MILSIVDKDGNAEIWGEVAHVKINRDQHLVNLTYLVGGKVHVELEMPFEKLYLKNENGATVIDAFNTSEKLHSQPTLFGRSNKPLEEPFKTFGDFDINF